MLRDCVEMALESRFATVSFLSCCDVGEELMTKNEIISKAHMRTTLKNAIADYTL